MTFIQKFLKDRKEVLKSLDLEEAKKYCFKYGIPLPSTEISLLAGLHKARLYANEITAEEKEISRQWLKENGFSENIF